MALTIIHKILGTKIPMAASLLIGGIAAGILSLIVPDPQSSMLPFAVNLLPMIALVVTINLTIYIVLRTVAKHSAYDDEQRANNSITPSVSTLGSRRQAHHATQLHDLDANCSSPHLRATGYIDAVTGLPNRLAILKLLEATGRGSDGYSPASLFFIDLDGFKRVNDTLGHDAGDELLRRVAKRLSQKLRFETSGDVSYLHNALIQTPPVLPHRPVLARFAGDEFVIFVPGDRHPQWIESLARRIISAFSDGFTVFDNKVFVTASVGFATMPNDATDPDLLMKYADLAMYNAKASGKNRYRRFDKTLKSEFEERIFIESRLRHSIVDGGFDLYFQPKFNSRDMAITSVEALARWNCPPLGMIAPHTFVSIAEQCGMIIPMSEVLLKMAIKQAVVWKDNGAPMRVAVNVSSVNFERPDFVDSVIRAVDDFHLPPNLLELEITEAAAMSDFYASKRKIEDLKRAGISVTIEDFGAGFSNLSCIAQLEFDSIKLDKSLVANIGVDRRTEPMLLSIVNTARILGYQVIAEGIERVDQLHFLTAIGCDQFQGFLLAHPMPAKDFNVWRHTQPIEPLAQIVDNRQR